MDASAYFHGKKITVMGLGLLGRGVGDTRYLAECGAELIVTDLKSREALAESVAQLESFQNITFILGEHRENDFSTEGGSFSGGTGPDLILKAAGVPLDSPYIAKAKAQGIPVRMSADLFMEISEIPIIGITGTRGKSTVTHMVHAILSATKRKVLLGGNVYGVSTLALLSSVTAEHTAVLELDSWQCQGLSEANISPHTAVFTTFYPDHTNYYKNNPGAYLSDKSNIFLYQDPDDVLIVGSQCAPTLIEAFGEHIVSHLIIADEKKLPSQWQLRIPGIHNRYNAALALMVARSLGIDDAVSRRTLETFDAVPGRLECIAKKDGISFFNDTTATSPEATLSALSALNPSRTVLIMGGADKNLKMNALITKLSEVKKIILLAGTGTESIKDQLPKGTIVYESMKEAVTAARSVAVLGDNILLSPAFASFGLFKNEYDRGDRFNALVQEI